MNHRIVAFALVLPSLPALALAETTVAAPDPTSLTRDVAPASQRHGFTLEVGTGVGATYATWGGSTGDSGASTDATLPAISLGAGAWIGDRLAVTLRASTALRLGGNVNSTFIGPAAQYHVADRIFVGGGAGIGVPGLLADEAGVAFDLRAGYDVMVKGGHVLHLGVEATPMRAFGMTSINVGAHLGWQLL